MAGEVDAGDDVAPLVRAAELDGNGALIAEVHKVVRLQELVRELSETNAVVGGEAVPHRVLCYHGGHARVLADVAQEVEQ